MTTNFLACWTRFSPFSKLNPPYLIKYATHTVADLLLPAVHTTKVATPAITPSWMKSRHGSISVSRLRE